MKNLVTVLIIIVCGINYAHAQSSIKVRLSDNSPFNVAVDGRYFNKRGTSVTVGDLPPGRHRVQIYCLMNNRRGRGREEIIYEGNVRTSEGMVSILSYDPISRNREITEMDFNTFNANRPAPYSNGMNNPGNQDNNRNNYNQEINSRQKNGNYQNNGYNQNNNNQRNDNYRQPAPPVTGSLTDAKIDQLKTNVAAKKTDTEKTTFLKGELKDEQITTSQVSTMMDWLSFESSKEEFAEWAYSITVDKDAYGSLDSKFSYKNYQDDLDKFLKSKQ